LSEIRSQATPARDELAALILAEPNGWRLNRDNLADRILAAGWSKPHTVNAPSELDALPMFTVIRSEQGSAWERQYGALGKPLWIEATQTRGFPHTSDEITLPATVLFTPGDAG
jgi:hypothetical protein